MKNDLITSIVLAIVGVVGAYFVCNLFAGEIQPYPIKVLDSSVSNELAEPDPEVFNYHALNPTVEVYVGNCQEYDANGECLDDAPAHSDDGYIVEDDESANSNEGQ